ncbi:helix-turn-helix domain-containing protein [Rhizobium leguminosarum]|nr:helix-turn-helix domain-containing protein [Rhizobium leguminosarum]
MSGRMGEAHSLRTTSTLQGCRVVSGRLRNPDPEDGHVISWQRRDVNLPPVPILKLMAVASRCCLYIISSSTQRRGRETHPLPSGKANLLDDCDDGWISCEFSENGIWRERRNNNANPETSWFFRVLRGASSWQHPRYEEIVSLHTQGMDGKTIARKLGIGKNSVYRTLNSIKNKQS